MSYIDCFWMSCDSTEQLRAEYGPYHTREEAESESRRLGFKYVLRYEHVINDDEEIREVRCVFIELPLSGILRFHTRCATCGVSEIHDLVWRAEVWADIHEFEHSRHFVRLFHQTRGEGLKEVADWRKSCA